ncbi:DUF2141 domain-containing protein [Massilia forsythiae]|uniref:DUF2141 domain-containing protein n=1 Tax=Massilia forsythiae TaxID=2728020 RepID=A0A7Z2VXT5_9BURK|nr:DUF2141 domain-containing protein [Massilia forsythiae]QJE00817.1 DUF2141 domain-containing protein [Massilia forsythiae]
MPLTIRTLLPALAACAVSVSQAADLTIRVDNVQSGDGQVMVALYDGAGYLKQPLRTVHAPAAKGATTLVIQDLAPGAYAIAAYHDRNANDKLDANPMGMPLEPYAFGNDAEGRMGPPAFDAASVTVPAAGLAASVTLR